MGIVKTSFGLQLDVELRVAVGHEVREDDDDPFLLAVRARPVDDDLVHGLGRQAPRLGDSLEEGGGADELVHAGTADGADDGDLLIFLDEDGDVGALGVLLIQERRDPDFELLGGESRDLDFAEQGQRDRAVLRDADRLVELRELEHGDLEQVLRPDAIVVDRDRLGFLEGEGPGGE